MHEDSALVESCFRESAQIVKVFRMSYLHTDLKTPWGNIAAVVRAADETVLGAAFGQLSDLVTKSGEELGKLSIKSTRRIPFLAESISNWLDGKPKAFTHLNVEQAGGDYFQRVWASLRMIPHGEVVTYAELAGMAGRPKAIRAAGSACARNLIAPFIPCHRVVTSGGAIGNYGFGSELKYDLLVHEGVAF
jgi:methylated-DNA-[protein]-cysteine S-methyltransferase